MNKTRRPVGRAGKPLGDTLQTSKPFFQILLVEDSPVDARLVGDTLRRQTEAECSIQHVSRLDDALRQLESRPFDVVLLDLSLPDSSGIETLVTLRNHSPLIPIVALTARKEPALPITAIQQGAQEYVLKTKLDASHLVSSIRYAIERVKLQEALRESEEHFKTLADSGQALIWTSGLDKKCDYFNKPWLEFTGRALEQELGDGWAEGVHPDDLNACVETYITAFDRRERFSMEYRIRHHSGEYRWIQDDGSPRYNMRGEFLGFIGHCLDVTEHKNAQSEILRFNTSLEKHVKERTAQLLQSNKELESFSYSISHDLRAPLRAIDGFSRILAEEYSTRLDPEGLRLLTVIRENTNRMTMLIDALLSLSRVGRTTFTNTEVNMTQLARSAFEETVSPESREPGMLHIADLPVVSGDPTLLRQGWLNLISNAWKFSRSRQRRIIEISSRCDATEFIYLVKDNGAGFDPAYKQKLFGVFQRLHSAKEFEGTGIGLAIVRRIIERHGGRVWAEGNIDEGATFYFSLPHEKRNNDE